MKLITLKQFKKKSVLKIVDSSGKVIRKVDLIEGREYIVNPINKNKYRHRGRKVILCGIESGSYGIIGKVKFLDSLRVGKVEIDDLDKLD